MSHEPSNLPRRDVLRSGALAVAAAAAAASSLAAAARALGAHAGSGEPATSPQPQQSRGRPLSVGVIGCGGRGTGAAFDALAASPDTQVVALADLFPDRVESARSALAEHGQGRGAVAAERCFTGFDAYQKLLASGVDCVILATPPGFRPVHFAAAVDAGCHAFIEKPVAVDPAGVRAVLAAADRADAKALSVVAGTQRRHERCYREAMARIRAGAIGRPVAARCYWNQGGLWHKDSDPALTPVQNQVRNWLYHTWLSGDHIVEQHVHNIDVVLWAFDALPVRVCATGGRQSRTGAEFGTINDHFSVHYDFPASRFAASMCRQQDGTDGRVDEVIIGTEGVALLRPGGGEIEGAHPWTYRPDEDPSPYMLEHVALQESIRGNAPRANEARQIARSTMAAILGRMSAYSGRDLTWDDALAAPLDLVPASFPGGAAPAESVARPGVTLPWPDRSADADRA
jgi:predicted dehydrogenase